MTAFDEWAAARKWTDSFKAAGMDHATDFEAIRGYAYPGACWIALDDKGRFWTVADRGDFAHEKLAEVERFLWDNHARYEAAVTKATNAKVDEALKVDGWEIYPTGGGCEAWRKKVGDKGAYLLITYEDGYAYGDPDDAVWMAGLYDEEGEDAGLAADVTLAEAIAKAAEMEKAA